MYILFFPSRPLSSFLANAIAMALGPFLYMYAKDGVLFQPPDRRHTVKQRGMPLVWSSLKIYPETYATCKPYRLIRGFPPKERKKMEELCKVTRILFIYFLTGKVDKK